jgi:hypothetical protein
VLASADLEVFSAQFDQGITEPCRILTIRGSCDTCGLATVKLHAPGVTHGWFCAQHCVVCNGQVRVSEAEREAMIANKLGLATKREKLAFKANQQWSNPKARLTKVEAIRIRCEARVRERQMFQNQTLRVGERFVGVGLIGDMIRGADGLPIRQLLAVSRTAGVSITLLTSMMKQGISEGVLTVEQGVV